MSGFSYRMMGTDPFKRMQIRTMARLFSNALGIRQPRLNRLNPRLMLEQFARFSANAARQAMAQRDGGAAKKARLRDDAYKMGCSIVGMRGFEGVSPEEIAIALYANIGIDLEYRDGCRFCMHACHFAKHYTPAECDFMSAFDQGILEGLFGEGNLVFEQRITEGCVCCMATLSRNGESL